MAILCDGCGEYVEYTSAWHRKCHTADGVAGVVREQMSIEIPRRNRVDLYVPAELAISKAIESVEKLPADTRLTEAVILLGDAQNKVSDFIDHIGVPEPDRVRIPADVPGIDAPSHLELVRSGFEECAKILDPLGEDQRRRVIRALGALFDA